jgi:hypothetical protein
MGQIHKSGLVILIMEFVAMSCGREVSTTHSGLDGAWTLTSSNYYIEVLIADSLAMFHDSGGGPRFRKYKIIEDSILFYDSHTIHSKSLLMDVQPGYFKVARKGMISTYERVQPDTLSLDMIRMIMEGDERLSQRYFYAASIREAIWNQSSSKE